MLFFDYRAFAIIDFDYMAQNCLSHLIQFSNNTLRRLHIITYKMHISLTSTAI